MKRTEWGLFTVAAGLAALAFPPFFVELVAIYSLGGIGYLWRVLDEKGRARLKEFQRDVRIPYTQEKEGKNREALAAYKKLAQSYHDSPHILTIVQGRIEETQKRMAQEPKPVAKARLRRNPNRKPRKSE